MGAKNSKVKKGEKKGAAAGDESSDQVDKTATLPASFKKKVKQTNKTKQNTTNKQNKPDKQTNKTNGQLQETGEEQPKMCHFLLLFNSIWINSAPQIRIKHSDPLV